MKTMEMKHRKHKMTKQQMEMKKHKMEVQTQIPKTEETSDKEHNTDEKK